MGRETLGEVPDGSEGHWGGPDRSGNLREFQDGSVDHSGGLRLVGGHSRRSGICRSLHQRSTTSRGTLLEVRDGSGYPLGGPGLARRP